MAYEAIQDQGYKATWFDESIKPCKLLNDFELDSLYLKRTSQTQGSYVKCA